MYRGRRVLRPEWPVLLMVIGATLLFAGGAVMTYRDLGWTWVSIGLAAAVCVGLGGIIETLITRIELTDDAMLVRDLRGRRRYPKTEIQRIAEAKGVPPALVLKDGRVVKLPSVASNLGNSVRAWLTR
jgi:hypothetical protein